MVSLLRMAAMLLLLSSAAPNASTMDITASFSPSMSDPENNTFTNTTPQSGFCGKWPQYCPANTFSIGLPITTTISKPITAHNDPHEGVFFGLPGKKREVMVTDINSGEKHPVTFTITNFSAIAHFPNDQGQKAWDTDDGTLGSPSSSSSCSRRANPAGGRTIFSFVWNVPAEDVACYATSAIDRTEPTAFDGLSIGYNLITPNPLIMGSGTYTGVLSLSVGPGGDFDFGNNYQASDTNLTINFTLSVNHELKLTTSPEDRQVTLQPCASGRVCTEEEGKANWERSTITRIAPQLTGRSHFTLSSSGAFTVFLQCDQQIGQDCALQSEHSAKQVPVQALLTLPTTIVDQHTGSTVIQKKIRVGKDTVQNVFNTTQFGQDRKGSIDFVIAQKDVENMLKTRPDNYKGTMTVIFDPQIY